MEAKAIDQTLKGLQETSAVSQTALREIDTQTNLIRQGIAEVSAMATTSDANLERLNREMQVFKTEVP
jgi:hypothetical protein